MSRSKPKRNRPPTSGAAPPASDQPAQHSGDSAAARPPLSFRRKIAFSVVTVLLFFVALEGLLRLVRFEIDQSVETMAFTFPIDDYNADAPQPFLRRDPVLFWKPTPGVLDHNSHGFYGPEFSSEKPEGVFRIVCLGDSCTHFGPETYPDMLRAMLDQIAPGEFEVINAGVIGYTSHQGRKLLEEQALRWSPDLVTVYFGWNDHWLARDLTDLQQPTGKAIPARFGLQDLRTFQLLSLMRPASAAGERTMMRVPLADYRDNLKAIDRLSDAADARTWYLTAPHAFDLSIPPYLYTSGEVADPDGLIELHESYNEVVRRTASEQNETLIDLAAEMEAMDKQRLFIEDHIHLSEQGRLYVAQRLLQTLVEQGLVELPDIEPDPRGADER